MKNRIIQIALKVILPLAMLALLKFEFESSNLEIIGLIVFVLIFRVITLLFGFINPPNWLYKIRQSLSGIFFGIFMGIFFSLETTENGTLEVNDLMLHVIIFAVAGGIFLHPILFTNSKKRRKRGFLSGRHLLNDISTIIVANGERFEGELILTKSKLLFLSQKNDEKLIEKELEEINPVINTYSFLGIPNGIRLEDKEKMVFRTQFPYYWLKKIEKRKDTNARLIPQA